MSAGTTLRLVDAGGGLGIPYEPHEESLDLVRLGAGLADLTRDWDTDPVLSEAGLLLEPGRFLVGPAGAYLARVVDCKTVNGSMVVILDGGVHHVLRPALVGQEHRLRAFSGSGEVADNGGGVGGRLVPVTVAGALCSGLDVFSQSAVMTPPEVGDLVAVLDVGAYGFTESMPLFLSHPIPAEVAVRGGRAELIRPRQDPSEWLDRQVVPAWPSG
jgi:diaminopimelate decarboxylase